MSIATIVASSLGQVNKELGSKIDDAIKVVLSTLLGYALHWIFLEIAWDLVWTVLFIKRLGSTWAKFSNLLRLFYNDGPY